MSDRETHEAPQASPMSNMRIAYSTDGAALYTPIIAPQASSSPLPTPTYQPGGSDALGVVQPGISAGGSGGVGGEMVVKRRRGRPRKYAPDGSTGHGAALASPRPKPVEVQSSGFPSQSTPATAGPAALLSGKKARGRPPGSGNKQQKKHQTAAAASGSAGVGFTPYVIEVKAGEDVLGKLMSFSQHTTNTVCILSANGSISNVTIRQQATFGGTVTYEGRFEILALCGSFMVSEGGGQRSRTCCLSVSLAGPDGRVLGGGVAGLLTAASPVQIIVGTFTAPGQNQSRSGEDDAMAAQTKLPSGTSAGGSLSESSGGPGSPFGQSNNSNAHGGMANMGWR